MYSESWYKYNADKILNWQSHYEKIKNFSDDFFDSFHKDIDLESMLFWACWNGELKIVKMIIEKYKFNPNVKSRLGWTPLRYANCKGYSDIIYVLKKYGA